MTTAYAHYDRLFRRVVREEGALDNETITSIIGFSAGGPVSICRVTSRNVYVTCELSLYPSQRVSAQGVRFELLSRAGLEESTTISMLTALGNFSMNVKLGDGHTVDLRAVLPKQGVGSVRLSLYSRVGFLWPRYGIYEVTPLGRHGT